MTKSVKTLLLMTAAALCGCVETYKPKDPEHTGEGVFHKTTDKIEKFDPNAQNQAVSDQKIRTSDPITGPVSVPLTAYRTSVEKLSIIAVDQALAFYYAEQGRYPKDYDEFMEKIVKANNIKLPVLPYKGKYAYDEANHQLIVVRSEEDAAKAEQ